MLILPSVERLFADPSLPDYLSHRDTHLRLLQHASIANGESLSTVQLTADYPKDLIIRTIHKYSAFTWSSFTLTIGNAWKLLGLAGEIHEEPRVLSLRQASDLPLFARTRTRDR